MDSLINLKLNALVSNMSVLLSLCFLLFGTSTRPQLDVTEVRPQADGISIAEILGMQPIFLSLWCAGVVPVQICPDIIYAVNERPTRLHLRGAQAQVSLRVRAVC